MSACWIMLIFCDIFIDQNCIATKLTSCINFICIFDLIQTKCTVVVVLLLKGFVVKNEKFASLGEIRK